MQCSAIRSMLATLWMMAGRTSTIVNSHLHRGQINRRHQQTTADNCSHGTQTEEDPRSRTHPRLVRPATVIDRHPERVPRNRCRLGDRPSAALSRHAQHPPVELVVHTGAELSFVLFETAVCRRSKCSRRALGAGLAGHVSASCRHCAHAARGCGSRWTPHVQRR